MADKEKIKEALSELDTVDDDQWTNEGAPLVEVVSRLVGENVTRQEIVEAAPKFTRENPELEEDNSSDGEEQPNETAPDPDQDSEPEENITEDEPSVKDLENRMKEIDGDRADIEREITELKEHSVALKFEKKKIQNYINSLSPNSDNQTAIREFINSQNQSREDRVNVRNGILRGVDPSTLDPRSKLDAAMSRKNNRGSQRPARS